jgi:hypothetical protein
MPKVLIANPLIPHPEHDVQSANVVVFELMRSLHALPGFEVQFLKIDQADERPPNAAELSGLEKMRAMGIKVHEPLRLPAVTSPPPVRTLADLTLRHLHPESEHAALACRAVEALGADVLLVPWTEWVTALLADVRLVKFAYYGNADAKVFQARARVRHRLGGESAEAYAQQQVIAARLEEAHLECMAKYHLLGNVARNDARYYAAVGHPNAFYIQNLWIDRFGLGWREKRDVAEAALAGGPAKISASIGNTGATANSHGLEYLVTRALPALRRELADIPFELHVIGGGKPWPALAERLKAEPEIKLRGFVDDIDEELLGASIFLNVNNATDFKVGHTRYLHGWSLGCCVVAHRDAALSMPEIVHEENALLGRDEHDIARQVRRALTDPALRRRLGEAGFATQQRYFTSDAVAARIADKIMMFMG